MANQEALIIKDSGGTEADVTAANALKVDGSAVTQPVSGTITITPSGTQDVNIVGNTIGLASETAVNDVNNSVRETHYGEDNPHTTGDPGELILTVRNDNLATTFTSTDGDYSPIAVDNKGAVFVSQIVGALPAGTNNIGDVDVLSLPALPAGTNNIGDVDVLTLPAITIAAAQTLATVTTVGAVTAITNALPAGTNNIGDVDVLSLPALPAGTNNIGDVDVLTLPAITIAAAQTLATVTTVGAVTAITNALPAGTNNIGDVDILSIAAGTNRLGSVRLVDSADADLTSAKGTQTTRFIGAQRSIDAGRNARHFMLDTYTAAPLVEAVQSVVQWYSNAAVAGATQPAVVPAGKTLRLTHYSISTKSLATVGSAVVRIRANTAGLGVLGSPLVFSMECGSRAGATTTAMTGGLDTFSGVFPEGLEFPAGTGLAFSMAGYGPAGSLLLEGVTRFAVYGYEY